MIKIPNGHQPPPPDARTAAGMRVAANLLEAIHANDAPAAERILDGCADPSPALFALACLVLSAAEQMGQSMPAMLAGLRAQIPGPGA